MAAIRRSDRKRKCTERGLAALSEGTQLDTANAERGRPVRADSDVGSGDEAYVPELPWSPPGKHTRCRRLAGAKKMLPTTSKPASKKGRGKSKKGAFQRLTAKLIFAMPVLPTGGVPRLVRTCNETFTFTFPSGKKVPLSTSLAVLRADFALSEGKRQEMIDVVKGFNETHGQEEAMLSLPRVQTLGDLLAVERWCVMNYDVWNGHCADHMTNEKNVSVAKALRGFWDICADSKIISHEAAAAIAAGHTVMDVFCLSQKTKSGGKDLEHEGEFERLCCGADGAKRLLDLHHKRCALLLKIQQAAFGKKCGAVAFGENTRSYVELLERKGLVENLGGVMHPSCWQLLQFDIAARLAAGKPVPGGLDRDKHFLGADKAFGAVIKHAGVDLLKPPDYWANLWAGKADAIEAVKQEFRAWLKEAWAEGGVLRKSWAKDGTARLAHEKVLEEGWKEGGVYRESMKDGPTRAALERLWALNRDRAKCTARFEALEKADVKAGGDGQWWLRREGYGPSRFTGVGRRWASWRVQIRVDGATQHLALCENDEDAARLYDYMLVLFHGEAPKNFPEELWPGFVEWVEAGGQGDVPPELHKAAAHALRRVGPVKVTVSEETAKASLAEASSVEAEIADAVAANPTMAETDLADVQLKCMKKSVWDAALQRCTYPAIERLRKGQVRTVGDLALVDVDEDRTMALTGQDKHGAARRELWTLKRAAALQFIEKLALKPPKKNGNGRAEKKRERTTEQQQARSVPRAGRRRARTTTRLWRTTCRRWWPSRGGGTCLRRTATTRRRQSGRGNS